MSVETITSSLSPSAQSSSSQAVVHGAKSEQKISIKVSEVLLGLGIFYFAYQTYKLREAIQINDPQEINRRLALGGWHLFQYFVRKEEIKKLAEPENIKALTLIVKKIDFEKIAQGGRISRAAEALLSLRDDTSVDHLIKVRESLLKAFDQHKVPSILIASLNHSLFQTAKELCSGADLHTVQRAIYETLYTALLEQASKQVLEKTINDERNLSRGAASHISHSFQPRAFSALISQIGANRFVNISNLRKGIDLTMVRESIYQKDLRTEENPSVLLKSVVKLICETPVEGYGPNGEPYTLRSAQNVLNELLENGEIQKAIEETLKDSTVQTSIKKRAAEATIQQAVKTALPFYICPKSRIVRSAEYSLIQDAEAPSRKRLIEPKQSAYCKRVSSN